MLLKTAVKKFIQYIRCKEYAENTVRGYESVLRDFMYFSEIFYEKEFAVRQIKVRHLDDYMVYRKEKGDEAVSRNRTVYILRSFFNFLQLKDYVLTNEGMKLEAVKYCPKERSSLGREEMQALIEAIDHPVIRCAVTTMANTGLRISEICALTLDDVDLEAGMIAVRRAKGNKNRKVPINRILMGALQRYIETERSSKYETDRFFCTYISGKLSPQYLNKVLADTAANLQWRKPVSAHILRHSFASELIRSNAHVSSVQALLGHSDLRITSRYIHTEMELLRGAVELLADKS